jgi:hypothetical protein
MTDGLPLFDAAAARVAAEQGMARAAENKKSLLKFAREVAVELGQRTGLVTADDVQHELGQRGISEHALGNAAGSLFRDKTKWIWTGRLVSSERVCSHGNLLRVWQYVGK